MLAGLLDLSRESDRSEPEQVRESAVLAGLLDLSRSWTGRARTVRIRGVRRTPRLVEAFSWSVAEGTWRMGVCHDCVWCWGQENTSSLPASAVHSLYCS